MIKVDNISKTYELDNKDKVIGIKNISFEVKEGNPWNNGKKWFW